MSALFMATYACAEAVLHSMLTLHVSKGTFKDL